jgi:hypothetical protein
MPKLPPPEDLIVIEPSIKSPMMRAKLDDVRRIYYWFQSGSKVRINEPDLYKRLANVKLVCTVEDVVRRLYNIHSLVINHVTGEVFDGSSLI